MYYKVLKDGRVIDALDRLQFVKYQPKHDIMVNCTEDDAQGIISSNGKYLDLYRSKLLSLEEHQKEQDIVVEDHGRKIAGVEQRVNKSEHGINVMMKALLALLSHGIDGNAIDPMKEAKAALESYLIDGQNLKDI